MSSVLALYALNAMLVLSPIDGPHEVHPGWNETSAQRSTRYQAIAADIAAVAEESCKTEVCARNAVITLVGIAQHESDFAPDVDAGRCYRGRDGRGPRCDGGTSHSIWQLKAYFAEDIEQLKRDRRYAAMTALKRVWRSVNACSKNQPDERLAAYAGGRCDGEIARKRARELYALVRKASTAR